VPTSASGVFASRAFPRTFIASRGFATGTPISTLWPFSLAYRVVGGLIGAYLIDAGTLLLSSCRAG
jgi:hypothetical protein